MSRSIDKEARKEQLAEAVWQVILEKGIGAVSVRTVAEQAGLVVGSLRYIFPTRTELLNFSAELMVDRATQRVLATPRNDNPEQFAFEVVKRLLPLEPDSRAELEVNLALVGECPAQPSLIDIRNHAHRQLGEAIIQLVHLLTETTERDDAIVSTARRLHALVDGLALHLLHADPTDNQWALDLIQQEITLIAHDPSLGDQVR